MNTLRYETHFEVDLAAVVLVEGSEDVVAERLSVAVGEEAAVDLDKLPFGQLSAGAVANEAAVPAFDLLLAEAGVGHQELDVVWMQFLLRVAHDVLVVCVHAQSSPVWCCQTRRRK